MSVALPGDRNKESVDNITGAPDIAAQQKLEHQAATQSSSSSQQHVDGGSGQQHLSESSKTFSQQVNDNKTGQH
ncbi:unnamed protein product [Rotaria sordida]|uniref:Uncharacterized protein n=1 Tax=Rotaria sordida TaxID=392033 RepID=A0A815I5K8_9BILA|nr:unnamed protein product [Rotaria sordida]